MKRNHIRNLFLLLIAITFAAAVLVTDKAEKQTVAFPEDIWPQACADDERDVTTFMKENTDLVSDLSTRWKEGCPEWLCGRNADKFIRLDLMCMKQTGADTYEARAIGTAGAKFVALARLANLQSASAAAIIDFKKCTISLTRKITFKQPVVTSIAGLFVGVGQSVSIRDSAKNNRCDHYRPPEMS
jgi:hypothetical protein